jgi:hypothetical protein
MRRIEARPSQRGNAMRVTRFLAADDSAMNIAQSFIVGGGWT